MLLGINANLTPDLLHSLAAMGHGDQIAIVDCNFPSATCARRVYYLPGLDAVAMLEAVLSVLPLDTFVPSPSASMQVVGDAAAIPPAVQDFAAVLARVGFKPPEMLERFAFYEAAKQTFAIVQTGERRPYGNIILTKGVI
ncbi:MAG: ribose ABC transporter [Acetobacteraceae bacterium]|nr:ribose ABC transporter [Acetobacteraceae bacterium]